jgi:hypothetical protein
MDNKIMQEGMMETEPGMLQDQSLFNINQDIAVKSHSYMCQE